MTSEKWNEYMRKYYQKNKDRINEQRKQKRHENAEEFNKKRREYYAKHKDAIYKSQRKWVAKNKKLFSKLCQESRRRRVERLKAEGIKNAWEVAVFNKEPIYER